MANIKTFACFTNDLDDCTVTARSSDSGYPASNVQDRIVKKQWRSLSGGLPPPPGGTMWLQFDAGVGNTKTVNCAFLFNYAVYVSGEKVGTEVAVTEKLQYSSNGTTWFDAGVVTRDPIYNMGWCIPSASYLDRYWRFYWEYGASDWKVRVGRAWGGIRENMQVGVRRDWKLTHKDLSVLDRAEGGQHYSAVKDIIREITFGVRAQETDVNILRTGFLEHGRTGEWVLCLRPDTETHLTSLYCRFKNDFLEESVVKSRKNVSVTVEECL